MESELPKGWELVTIEEISENITSGGTPSRKNLEYYENGTILWVKSGDLNDDYLYNCEEKITKEGLKNSNAKIFPKDTVLIAMYGATIGKTAILGVEASTNQACCGISLDKNKVLPKFMFYFLKSKIDDFKKSGFGGAQDNISQGLIRRTTMPIPFPNDKEKSLKIQNQIVAKLDQFFKEYNLLKEEKEKAKGNYEKILQSAMAKLLETLDTKEKPLSELFEVRKEKKDPSQEKIENYVGLEHIESNTRKILGFEKVPSVRSIKNAFYQGDILYGKLRPYLNKVCIAPFEGVCSTDIIALKANESIDPEFLLYILNSYSIVEQLSHLSYGMRMPRVAEKHFEQIMVEMPSLPDQKKVVEKLKIIDGFYSNIEELNKNIIADVQNMPHSVLIKAFAGELA